MARQKLVINPGNHNREYCPVSVVLDASLAKGETACADLLNAKGDAVDCVPAQLARKEDKVVATFVVDRLDIGNPATYELRTGGDASSCSPRYAAVDLTDVAGEKVDVTVRGARFTSYHYDTDKYVRPFLYPVIGPFGNEVTREIEGKEGPDFDHVHHKSIYVAHGDVNGANCWDEMPGHGSVTHQSFKRVSGGPVYGEVSSLNFWRTNAGEKVCEQTSNLRFYNLPSNLRIIDFVVKFHATEGDVQFGDTKEGGILSLRVQPTMNVSKFGRMTNGYGAINEGECWGKRAPWCDYSGPAFGEWVGITYMNHPTSFRYPTYWHTRDYGLMTANPFGVESFEGPGHDGSHLLSAGETLAFAYRIYIHPGDAAAGKVADRFHDYISPPTAEVV